MYTRSLLQTPKLTKLASLKTLVENRTIFNLNHCELNLFETYQSADKVALTFNDVVLTSMLRGKKVMHLFDDPEFDYLPGETVILPQQVEMVIDFPEAQLENPTQCLALEIDRSKIQQLIDVLNERYPKEDADPWQLNFDQYFLMNNEAVASTLNKIVQICMSELRNKDILADLSLQELLIHLIQLQKVNELDHKKDTFGILPSLMQYIREHLHEKINLHTLCQLACMSSSTFYRYVKKTTGLSPQELILRERLKYAKQLLGSSNLLITEVAFDAGFDDANYFTRAFKKNEGLTPKQYQQKLFQSSL
jgi:AraC-like DNA-binding protein